MTGEQFKVWRSNLGLSQSGAAEALDLALNTIQAYESGELPIPKVVELACKALMNARD
ncbi:MAG: helix-turn-helix transcriptional regulator [Alphaproteobacteria bacterium]|jgi:transcriptional regulator with XRE-family HTH domain|nr:helix-turn-helix transcriptional regulator [Alphaproteobacteria bacterium]